MFLGEGKGVGHEPLLWSSAAETGLPECRNLEAWHDEPTICRTILSLS